MTDVYCNRLTCIHNNLEYRGTDGKGRRFGMCNVEELTIDKDGRCEDDSNENIIKTYISSKGILSK